MPEIAIPQEIWLRIFSFLPIQTLILNVQFCSIQFYKLAQSKTLWKRLCWRDFDYLMQDLTKVEGKESSRYLDIQEWKKQYFMFRNIPNLTGIWIGDYRTHGKELLLINDSDGFLVATKLTGDPNIPRGKISFSMRLTYSFDDKSTYGTGEINLAHTGYSNPHSAPCQLEHVWNQREFLIARWFHLLHPETTISIPCVRAPCHINMKSIDDAIAKFGLPDHLGNIDCDSVFAELGLRRFTLAIEY